MLEGEIGLKPMGRDLFSELLGKDGREKVTGH